MAQGTLRLPDPEPEPSLAPRVQPRDRRRRVRQKLHSPVYASFNGPQASMVVDLSELLDLHEEGFAVQTGEMLEVNRPVALTLDLPETRTFIHGSGQVVWSDPSGRGGIRFSSMPESSQRLLREWLFANLLIACSNHATRSEQLSRQAEESVEIPREPLPSTEPTAPTLAPDLNDMLSQVDAIHREIREAGADRDAVFQFIIAHALRLTGADGAALAFLTNGNMICRARAGEPAIPLGTLVDRKQGLSGECLRTAMVIGCQDTENDPRVDRETCRALGIGSMLAVPMFSGYRVVGMLQVFSAHPRTFTKAHETILERLVEAVPDERSEPPLQLDGANAEVVPAPVELAPEADSAHSVVDALLEMGPKPLPAKTFPRQLLIAFLVIAIAAAAMASGYFFARHWLRTAAPSTDGPLAAANPSSEATRSTIPNSPEELHKLAEAGDAEAQYWMGIRYGSGAGVAQDNAHAAQWLLRAALQGHVLAQAKLGSYYWTGRGVPRDLPKAYFWASLAWAQGDKDSKALLEGISTQMTNRQVVAAREQADAWLRQHNSVKQKK